MKYTIKQKKKGPSRSSFEELKRTSISQGKKFKTKEKKKANYLAEYLNPLLRNISAYNVANNSVSYPRKLRKALISEFRESQLEGLRKPIEGILRGKNSLKDEEVEQLKGCKHDLTAYCLSKNNPRKQRKILLRQRGGFLPFLIPILTGIATSAVAEGAAAGISAAIAKKKRR